MSLIFECSKCKVKFQIKIDDNIIKISGKNKDNPVLAQITSIAYSLAKRKICDSCYQKLIIANQEEKDQIKEKIEQIDILQSSIEKEISSRQFQSVLQLDEEEFLSTFNQSQSKYMGLIDKEKELERELQLCLSELEELRKSEKETVKIYTKLEKDTYLISREFNKQRGILSKNQQFQTNILNNGNNIYDDLFEIKIEEKFGMINGSRMIFYESKLNYEEISCGWGHIIFLTEILIKKAHIYNKKIENSNINIEDFIYELYSFGNFSYIINKQTQQKFPFYFTNDSDTEEKKIQQLNDSMLEYLKILKYLDDIVKNISKENIKNTYFKINDMGINHCCIVLDAQRRENGEQCTQCIKFVLLFLKITINIIVNYENENTLKSLVDKADMVNFI